MDFASEKFDIVVIAGQSNAEGNGLSDSNEQYVDEECFELVDLNYKTADEYVLSEGKIPLSLSIRPLQERLDIENHYRASFAESFAKHYRESGLLEDGRRLLVVRAAIGGSGFRNGQQGKGHWASQRTLKMVDYALSLNKNNRIVAYLWHQGEHDAFEAKDGVEELRSFFYPRLKEQTMEFLDRYSSFRFPFICGGFSSEWAKRPENIENTECVKKCLMDLVDEIGFAGFVETDDLGSNDQVHHNGDAIHFSKKSLWVIGDRLFAKYIELVE